LIQEDGVLIVVDFETGHKTGFFCDQRENRKHLLDIAADKTLLDLCCYTGGFGLVGGRKAKHVTLVDLDEKALAVAEENAKLNQYFGSRARYRFTQCDAFNYMRQVEAINQRFDVVVLDPPKLIATRAEFEEGRRKYSDMNTLAMDLVEPGGRIPSHRPSAQTGAEQAHPRRPLRGAQHSGGAHPAPAGQEKARLRGDCRRRHWLALTAERRRPPLPLPKLIGLLGIP